MRRAAVSLYARVAEGHAQATAPDALRAIGAAQAVLADLRTHVELAHAVGFVDAGDAEGLRRRTRWVDELLRGYAQALAQRS